MADLLEFPDRRAEPVPSWLPRSARQQLKRIGHWLEGAQAGLTALPGPTTEHQRALRRIADELRAGVVAEWTVKPPR